MIRRRIMQKYLLVSLKIINETTCYLYPQYEYGEDGISLYPINNKKDEFPDMGTIYLPKAPEENLNKYLYKLFKVAFDTENVASNYNEFDLYSRKSKYYLRTTDIVELSMNELIEVIECDKSLEEILKDKSNRFIRVPFLPLNKKILIKNGGWCYGPFKYSVEDDTECVIKLIPESYEIEKYNYEEVKQFTFEAQVTSNYEDPQKEFIRDLYVLENEIKLEDTIPFVDNETIMQECIDILSESASISDVANNGVNTLKNIKKLIEKFPDSSKQHDILTEENVDRILGLVKEFNHLDKYKDIIIEQYYSSGKVSEEEKADYVERHPELITSVIENSVEYKKQMSLLNDEKQTLETEISELKQKKDKEYLTLQEIQENNKKYTDEVLETIKNEIESLKREKKDLVNKSAVLKEQNDLAENQKNKLKREINDLNIDIKSKVLDWLESKRDDDIIGLLVSEFGNYKVPISSNEQLSYDIASYDSAEKIINRIDTYFKKAKREITKDDVINYLILISSNFITVFGGQPGTGKTSTCNILAKALGVEKERYADISVGRGWSSSRDLVGYYNPLTHCIEKSQPKFSSCLETMTVESETALCDAMYLVLLDEANLSQIEHYWSEFNKISDDFAGKVIQLSEETKYTLTEELRFVATINYDHTTEILSPRFLDRAWIIMLDQINCNELFGSSAETVTINNAETMISYSDLKKFFTIECPDVKNKQLSPLAKEILTIFVEKFKNVGHIISPRSLIGMKNYCIVAEHYMTDEKQKAVDYAIAQKLLSQIDGNGKRYLEFLENLSELCEEHMLSKCSKILSKIIENGKQEHNYFNYFNL